MPATFLKAPFGYPGGKLKSLQYILPVLEEQPHSRFVEVFGGTGVITMNKEKVDLNVYNDAYSGVTDFYICMREPELYKRLIETLEEIPSGFEMWDYCSNTWSGVIDRVERAARWYLMTKLSFANLGRHYGRSKTTGNQVRKWDNKFLSFHDVHIALKNVLIENMDWKEIMDYYDSDDTVFYCDPPYLGTDLGSYKAIGSTNRMWNTTDHIEFLDHIFTLKGFVAVSSYRNELYLNQPWDDHKDWKVNIAIEAKGAPDMATKPKERNEAVEYLFIKDFDYAR